VLPPCVRSLLPRCLRVMGEGHSQPSCPR
jgi:hypothetical protein